MGTNKNKLILSLDASTTSTGWAIYEGDKLVNFGVIKPSTAFDWTGRIKYEFIYFKEIIKNSGVEMIVAESPPLKDGKATLQKLGAIQGMIISLAADAEIEHLFMTPSEWRSKLGCIFDGTKSGMTRSQLKTKAVAVANETFNLNLTYEPHHPTKNQDDIAEAILIGWAYLHPAKEEKAFETKRKRG